jgi:outer membrane lipoprotein SlyB
MRTMAVAVTILLLVACAAEPRHSVIIDKEGVDMGQYDRDLDQCAAYAEEVQTGAKTASGAGGGAVVGAAIGGILGGAEGAAKGAGVGAVSGGAQGLGGSEEEKRQVIKNCLRNRGYKVLN